MHSELLEPPLCELGSMTEIDPIIIDEQIVVGTALIGAMRFFNNFPERLAGGSYRDPRTVAGRAYASRLYQRMLDPHGERARWATYSGFFGDVDKAQHDAAKSPHDAFSTEEFVRLRAGRRVSEDALEAYVLYPARVYGRLRQMGYGHYDLIR